MPCGDGMTEGVQRALSACVQAIIPTMFRAQQPWAVMGSTASVLQGIPNYTPPDIDLVTTRDGAYIMSGSIGGLGATVRQVSYSESDRYTSHFGIFEVLDVKVEVMGDLVIPRCRWAYRYDGAFCALERQGAAAALRAVPHPGRSAGVAARGQRAPQEARAFDGHRGLSSDHGYDRPFLEALLQDKNHGERTVTTVREMMHLDD